LQCVYISTWVEQKFKEQRKLAGSPVNSGPSWERRAASAG